MKLAPLASQVIELALKRGLEVPAPFNNPPEVHEHLRVFYQAFADLNEERAITASSIPRITLAQIKVWLEWYGYGDDREFREEMKAHIRALDTTWVTIEQDRRKKLNKKGRRDGKAEKLRPKNEGIRQRHPQATE